MLTRPWIGTKQKKLAHVGSALPIPANSSANAAICHKFRDIRPSSSISRGPSLHQEDDSNNMFSQESASECPSKAPRAKKEHLDICRVGLQWILSSNGFLEATRTKILSSFFLKWNVFFLPTEKAHFEGFHRTLPNQMCRDREKWHYHPMSLQISISGKSIRPGI